MIGKVKNLKNLQFINLSHNMISRLAGIEVCVNLKLLNIEHNKISSINEIVQLKTLEEAYFANNLISYMPQC